MTRPKTNASLQSINCRKVKTFLIRFDTYYMLIIPNETSLALNRVVNRHKYVWESRKLSWTNSGNCFDINYSFNTIHLCVHFRLFFVRSTFSSPINPKYDDWFCQISKDFQKMFWNSKLAKLVFWISERFI